MAEVVYQQSLEIELSLRGIPFQSKRDLLVFDKDRLLDTCYRPDLLVYDAIVVELKVLKIHETETRDVITVLEVLSPSNKRPGGDGRRDYLLKRDQVLRSGTHLVELDLLRGGERLPMRSPLPPGDYYAIVSREQRRPRVAVYPWFLPDPLPTIPVPLMEGDDDVPLDLATAVAAVYDRARYHLSINYSATLEVPLPNIELLSVVVDRRG